MIKDQVFLIGLRHLFQEVLVVIK